MSLNDILRERITGSETKSSRTIGSGGEANTQGALWENCL